MYAYNGGSVITETSIYEREYGKTIAYELSTIDRYIIRELPEHSSNKMYEVTFIFSDNKSYEFETNQAKEVVQHALNHKKIIAKE